MNYLAVRAGYAMVQVGPRGRRCHRSFDRRDVRSWCWVTDAITVFSRSRYLMRSQCRADRPSPDTRKALLLTLKHLQRKREGIAVTVESLTAELALLKGKRQALVAERRRIDETIEVIESL